MILNSDLIHYKFKKITKFKNKRLLVQREKLYINSAMKNKKAKHIQRLDLKKKSLGRQGAENEASGLVGHMTRTHQERKFSWNGQAGKPLYSVHVHCHAIDRHLLDDS